jgi:hypothetical protein
MGGEHAEVIGRCARGLRGTMGEARASRTRAPTLTGDLPCDAFWQGAVHEPVPDRDGPRRYGWQMLDDVQLS